MRLAASGLLRSSETVYERAPPTRRRLREALAQAILARGYEQVRVQDVLDRADVARSTFYANFSGVHELLQSGHEELVEAVAVARRERRAAPNAETLRLSCVLVLFDHAARHADLYRAMLRWRGRMRSGERFVADLVRQDLADYRVWPSGRSLDLASETAAGALTGLIRWWLDRDMKISAAEMDRVFHELIVPGIVNYVSPE